jgi:hypothetical protein
MFFRWWRESIRSGHLSTAADHAGFVGELWVANLTAEIQNVNVPLGHKATFAVALLDHTIVRIPFIILSGRACTRLAFVHSTLFC